jgi:hypothetical protein
VRESSRSLSFAKTSKDSRNSAPKPRIPRIPVQSCGHRPDPGDPRRIDRLEPPGRLQRLQRRLDGFAEVRPTLGTGETFAASVRAAGYRPHRRL